VKKSWHNYTHLLTKRGRSLNNKFIVEGVRLCHEALLSDWNIETAFISEDFQSTPDWSDLRRKLETRRIHFTILKNSNFKKLADTEHPQGIALVIQNLEIDEEDSPLDHMNFLLILDGIRDPGNLGTIIRSADWFGVDGVVLSEGCAELHNPKVIRSTMGSVFHLPILEVKKLKHFLAKLKEKNFFIVATSVSAKRDLEKFQFKSHLALILGGEVRGISSESQTEADVAVKIRKFGKADSLNVAQAGAIAIHYIANQLSNKR
jgi:TrmH family RNA methyltransferase